MIPICFKTDMPCSSKFDLNRSSIESSSATNQRRPSFNAEILAASNKRVSNLNVVLLLVSYHRNNKPMFSCFVLLFFTLSAVVA